MSEYQREKRFPVVVQFLSKHRSHLETLWFLPRSRENGKLTEKDLLSVLVAVKNAPVKNFRWEKQEKINHKQKIPFGKLSSFWEGLEALSFRGTKFNKKDFLIVKYQFTKLRSLDLSSCKIDEKRFDQLLQNSEAFPMLERLYLNDNKIIKKSGGAVKFAGNKPLFPRLKTLSIFNSSFSPDTYRELIKKYPALFATVENLFFNNRGTSANPNSFFANSPKYDRDGSFIMKPGQSMAKNNLTTFYADFVTQLPNIKFTGTFFRQFDKDSSQITGKIFDTIGNWGWFFTSMADIENYVKNFETEFEEITLAGYKITKQELAFIAAHPSRFHHLRNIFLVHTQLDKQELFALRDALNKRGIRVHSVANSQSFPSPTNDFWKNTFPNNQINQPPPPPKLPVIKRF